MKQFIKTTALLLFAFVQTQAQAQTPEFKVNMNPDTSILLGNRFEVSFSLDNASGQNFQPPSFDGFYIVSGPNQSSSFSMINGETSQSLTYSYYLEPKEAGNYFIEVASIDTGDETLYTLPIEVVVLPNPDGIIQQPTPTQRKSFDFFNPSDIQSPFEKSKPKTKPKKKRKIYRI